MRKTSGPSKPSARPGSASSPQRLRRHKFL
jgi:hypothetical protein